MSEKERQIFLSWYKHQEDQRHCLLPQNIPDAVLEFLLSDCPGELRFGGEIVTIATLLVKSHVDGDNSIETSEEALKSHLASYQKHLQIEWLRRKKELELVELPQLANLLSNAPQVQGVSL